MRQPDRGRSPFRPARHSPVSSRERPGHRLGRFGIPAAPARSISNMRQGLVHHPGKAGNHHFLRAGTFQRGNAAIAGGASGQHILHQNHPCPLQPPRLPGIDPDRPRHSARPRLAVHAGQFRRGPAPHQAINQRPRPGYPANFPRQQRRQRWSGTGTTSHSASMSRSRAAISRASNGASVILPPYLKASTSRREVGLYSVPAAMPSCAGGSARQGAQTSPSAMPLPKGRWHKAQPGSPGMARSLQHATHSPAWSANAAPQSGQRGGNTRSMNGARPLRMTMRSM